MIRRKYIGSSENFARNFTIGTKEHARAKRIEQGMRSKKLFVIPGSSQFYHNDYDFFVTPRGYRDFETRGSVNAKDIRYEFSNISKRLRGVRYR